MLILIALVACTYDPAPKELLRVVDTSAYAQPDSDADTDTDADSDTDADTDTDTDTDADTDTDPGTTDTGTAPTNPTTPTVTTPPTTPTTPPTTPTTDTGPLIVTIPTVPTCVVEIPADAIVVDNDLSAGGVGGTYWVCRNQNFSWSGTGARIISEDGDIALNGAGNHLWLGAGAGIAAFNGDNEVVHEPGTDINDLSGVLSLTECPTITFDLTNAPANGC